MTAVLAAAAASAGLGLVLADLLRLPSPAASRAALRLVRQGRRRAGRAERLLDRAAGALAGRLRLGEFRRQRLEEDLRAADLAVSPERYEADCLVRSGLVALCALPLLPLSRPAALLALGAAGLRYAVESGRVGRRIRERRRRIEADLPLLVATIRKSLERSRDVLSILEGFRESAGPELRRELEITAADMRSGPAEVALSRLASRVGGTMMPDVAEGLKSAVNGDDTAVYWALLHIRFAEAQREALKAEAAKAPKRVRRLSMVLLFCLMLIYVTVIGQTLLRSLGGLFG